MQKSHGTGQFWRAVKAAWVAHGQQAQRRLRLRRQRKKLLLFKRHMAKMHMPKMRPAWLVYLPRTATLRLFQRS